MQTPSEIRLGDLLVQEKLLTEEQLNAALREQRSRERYVPLGHILVEWKVLTQKQLSLLLQRNQKQPRLGEVLLRNGSITPAQLEQALQVQREKHRPLGEVLVALSFVTEDQLRQALAIQLNIPYVDLDRVMLDRNLTRVINPNYARRHLLVPVSLLGQVLTVSMSDPTNTTVTDDLARSSGLMVNVVTSTHGAIKRAFKRLYESRGVKPPAEGPEPSTCRTSRAGTTRERYVEDRGRQARRRGRAAHPRPGALGGAAATCTSRCCRAACTSASGWTACCRS